MDHFVIDSGIYRYLLIINYFPRTEGVRGVVAKIFMTR